MIASVVGRAAAAVVLVQIGLLLPDLDQRLPLIGHRSALTHSMLLPLLLVGRWPAAAGMLAGGIAVHLAADLLPRGWYGYALIRLPLIGALDGMTSQIFLGINAAAGLILYHLAAPDRPTRIVLWTVLAISAVLYFLFAERWWPLALAVCAVATAGATIIRRR
ncbi:MAG: hypothetical protein AB7P02_00960 [Alphaproteobacteria bacterium]